MAERERVMDSFEEIKATGLMKECVCEVCERKRVKEYTHTHTHTHEYTHTHTHTHTHTYIYIYIYIYRERERERECGKGREIAGWRTKIDKEVETKKI